MVATRKSASKRKAPVKRRTTRKTASVAKKVTTLARAVKKLNKISYDKVQLSGLPKYNENVVQPYYQYHCEQLLNTWTPVFGYDANDMADVNKFYINSYNMDIRLRQDNEADQIYYSMFFVSLKDEANDPTTFDPLTGQLTLTSGVHYYASDNGRVLLNPRFFNIHKYRRFYMGGRAGDQSAPWLRDLSMKFTPKKRQIYNPKGNVFGVGGLSFPKDPSQNHYLLLFNDDAGADLQTNKINIHNIVAGAIPN